MRLMQIHIDWLRINLGSVFYIDTDQPVDLIMLLVSLFVIKCWLPAYVAKLASILGAFVIVGTRGWHRSNYQSTPLGVYTLWIVGKGMWIQYNMLHPVWFLQISVIRIHTRREGFLRQNSLRRWILHVPQADYDWTGWTFALARIPGLVSCKSRPFKKEHIKHLPHPIQCVKLHTQRTALDINSSATHPKINKLNLGQSCEDPMTTWRITPRPGKINWMIKLIGCGLPQKRQ